MKTTRPYSRKFLRNRLLSRITFSEAYVWLQILWNGPIKPANIFGIDDIRYKRRCIKKLVDDKYIINTKDGYKVIDIDIHSDPEDKETYLWLWPLRFKHISIPDRVLLCMIDEQIDGSDTTNLVMVSDRLGINRTTLYRHLKTLINNKLLFQRTTNNETTITCIRRLKDELKNPILESIVKDPNKYIGNFNDDIDNIMVGEQHYNGRGATLPWSGSNTIMVGEQHTGFLPGLLKGLLRVPPQNEEEGTKINFNQIITDLILYRARLNKATFNGTDSVLKYISSSYKKIFSSMNNVMKLRLIYLILSDTSLFNVMAYIKDNNGTCPLKKVIESIINEMTPDNDGMIYWDDGFVPSIVDEVSKHELGNSAIEFLGFNNIKGNHE